MIGAAARAAAAVSLAACTFPKPADLEGPVDAAVDARPDLVTGRYFVRHVTADGSADEPLDLTTLTVQALVPAQGAPGGFETRTGVGRADGTFEIEGVPPGQRYILKFNRTHYVTDRHQLELHTTTPSRAGVRRASAPTPVTITVEDLPPSESGDTVIVASMQAGAQAFMPPRAAGATQLQATIDWMTSAGPAGDLPDATHGDDLGLYVQRFTPGVPGALSFTRLIAAGPVLPATIVDGTANVLTATTSGSSGRFVTDGSIRRSLYENGHSQLARRGYVSISCTAAPAAAALWSAGGAAANLEPAILYANTTTGALPSSDIETIAGDYLDPFPETWPRLCFVRYGQARPVRIPGTSAQPFELQGGAVRVIRVSAQALAGVPLPPPSAIRVADQDGEHGGLIRNDGRPIEITWSPVSQATQYTVTLYQLRIQGAFTTYRLAAQIITDEERLTIPAELFAGSDFVAFEITAFSGSNDYAAGELYPAGVPGASSTAATAVFRWSATCGNGTIDLGEDCDGPSASCDADCTRAECGDGTRNAAAGELCDSIEDTLGCDVDCTANQCGDGHTNTNTEQCDDGGTAAGDGCSPTCLTE